MSDDDDLTSFWDLLTPEAWSPPEPDPPAEVYSSPIYCGHANECPNICPCGPRCYCRANTCRNRAV